jgi:Heterokaryon incompatibility protein (HET)
MPRSHYTPLPGAGPQTRILTLFPGTYLNRISCVLEIVNITQCTTPYEAVSYVWGHEMAPMPIICGDGELTITANLNRALSHLRLPDKPRRLWVDALCIDQENVEERERQVGYMRLVYKHAALTIVWLGPKTPGVELAFDTAKQLVELEDDLVRAAESGPSVVTFQGMETNPEVAGIMVESLSADPPSTDNLVNLFRREYFERVWCIQEVVVSKSAVARCEDLEMDFFRLLSLAKYVENYQGYRFPLGTLQYWSVVLISRKREHTLDGSMGNLEDLLMAVRDFKSTDSRDKIYAILGISNEGVDPVRLFSGATLAEQVPMLRAIQEIVRRVSELRTAADPALSIGNHPAIWPSYTKPVKDVYRELVRFWVRKSPRKLDILNQVQHVDDPSAETDWPSWVPRFDEPRSASFLIPGPYTAGIPIQGHMPYFAKLHDCPLHGSASEPDILQLDGFRVDQVEAVSEVMHFELGDPLPVQSVWNTLFDVPLFPRPDRKYVFGGENLDVAFFMTLCAGPMGAFHSIRPLLARGSRQPDRVESFQTMTRQCKINLLLWLQLESPACAEVYTDLAQVVAQSPDLMADIRGHLTWNAGVYRRSAWSICQNRRVYRTKSGLLGLGPQWTQPGDTVAVLFGGTFPFILRDNGPEWVFIGSAYLHHDDIMLGREVMSIRASRSPRIETFRLI